MAPSTARRRVLRAGALAIGLPGCLASPDGPGFPETFEDGGRLRGLLSRSDYAHTLTVQREVRAR